MRVSLLRYVCMPPFCSRIRYAKGETKFMAAIIVHFRVLKCLYRVVVKQ